MAILDERLAHTRRQLIKRFGAAAGALVSVPFVIRDAIAQVNFASDPFQLGVASGDPSPDGFVIWTRLAPKPFEIGFGLGNQPLSQPVEVAWEVAADENFATVVRNGITLASPILAHSVHVEVDGLQPDRPYWYRFRSGGVQSPQGRARTTPTVGAPYPHLKFGVAGCQGFPTGFYSAYRHLVAEDPAFVFFYGDYIYEYGGNPPVDVTSALAARRYLGNEVQSVDDYRRRYAQHKADADLQAAHAACAWFAVWDDHDIENNWTSEWDENGTPPELFRLRRQAAAQAYYEHMPLRRSALPNGASMQIYRRAVFGDLMDLNLLDTRQYRTDQPCGGMLGSCADIVNPNVEVMGRAQEAWLLDGLGSSRARWRTIAQQVMMMDLDRDPAPDKVAYNTDTWAGYQAPRARLLSHIRDRKISNVVVLTGDEHVNYAGELYVDGRKPGPAPVAVEFVATSISSGGDGQDLNDDGRTLLAANEQLKFANQQRGYVMCDVTPERWETSFRVMDKVTTPKGAISTRQKFVVEPMSNRVSA